ncbi:G-protein coupled receptor dmsr-1-like [Planococcus citri]|uniref:G-protein coupled receptor dmsr-1-like n=1 Tax=Planococcus citri TaxID=170843 RepID=UPI0031FA105E
MNASTGEPFCGTTLLTIGEYYSSNISGYFNIPICVIGVILNLLNILVFTKENMISPVNLIFTRLAMADLAVLVASIPFTYIENILRDGRIKERWTYAEAVVYVCSNHFATTLHFISVFLTIQLAVWRYIAIAYPLKERQWCSMRITRKLMVIGYVVCFLLSIPIYFSRRIEHQVINYRVTYTTNSVLFLTSRIIFSVLGALLPSIVLTVVSLRLIIILFARKTHHGQSHLEHGNRRRTEQLDRSIIILLAVLVLFLTAEFPRGMLFLSTVIFNVRKSDINYRCYTSLLSIFLSVVYMNTSITFFVYYTMSQQFRITFKSLYNRSTGSMQNETNVSPRIQKTSTVTEIVES